MKNFKPMLAEKADLEKLRFPLVAQPKFDGIRCTVLPELGPVTRTLKPIPNDHIRGILEHEKYHWHDGEIITYTDGEIDELNTVQSRVMSKAGEPSFIFHTFDHLELPMASYARRHAKLSEGSVVGCKLIYDLDELMAYEDGLVTAGWEGAILRDPQSAYKFGRSTAKEGILLKMKRFVDSEAEVIGFIEKMTNTNEKTVDERGYAKRSSAKAGLVPADTLGALVMRWDGGTEFEIGTGFDAEQRRSIWLNREAHLGQMVTFKYQRRGPKGAPLLPVFRCFRDLRDLAA
jgi:DNA ligase-1